ESGRAVRHELLDAEPSRIEPVDDLYRDRVCPHAGDDRAAAPSSRRQRRRTVDAVLRRALSGRASVFRTADEAAEGVPRHQSRVLARPGKTKAVRARPHSRTVGGRGTVAWRRELLHLYLRVEGNG